MNNNRIFYAIQAIGFSPFGQYDPADHASPSGFIEAHGVQSVGVNTTFNLDNVFELGQLELYESVEGIPDIEVSAQKVLDGYPLLWHLATPTATSASLVGRCNSRCFVALNIYPDTFDSASGAPITAVGMSGLYVSALSYTLPAEGNCTEDITLVGNDKVWLASGYPCFSPNFDGSDEPLSINGSGGVNRREDVLMGEGAICSILPTCIPGITASGTNPELAGAGYAAHIQTVTISSNLGRDQLYELGRRGPYYRYVTFPVEVTCAVEVTSSKGDQVNALADPPSGTNLKNESIVMRLREGTKIDLGAKNKLASITYGGGDASGGNARVTFNFSNYNRLTVTHPQDPAGM